MMKLRTGFTLVETMVVLVISTLILAMSLMMTHHLTLDRFRNYFFWQKFHNQFELAETNARRHHVKIIIYFNPHKVISFRSNYRRDNSKIMPPKDLTVTKANRVIIDNTGHIDPNSVKWSLNGRLIFYQKFQLGWGMYTFDYEKS